VAIDVLDRQRRVRIDERRIKDLADKVVREVALPNSSLAIVFVRDHAIRKLNSRYRGRNAATDVLSFGGEYDLEPRHLGDVVISTDRAVKQAAEAGLELEREISELVIHGILHLCGYDHETDDGQMNRIELKLRRKLLEEG
jgi:probable rRNA maturation factor